MKSTEKELQRCWGGFGGDIGDWGFEINTGECCTQIDNWPMLTDLSLSCNRCGTGLPCQCPPRIHINAEHTYSHQQQSFPL